MIYKKQHCNKLKSPYYKIKNHYVFYTSCFSKLFWKKNYEVTLAERQNQPSTEQRL